MSPKGTSMTPMLKQYLETKKLYQDCILFFRLGDFYEMFYDDAITASKALEITLTKKRVGTDREPAPLCGVPFHSAEGYIKKLIEQGFKVAICEQVEDPKLSKGIVDRAVIRVITPGTTTSDVMLSENENNYLCSIYDDEKEGIGLAWCDVSTGELCCTGISGEERFSVLEAQLSRISPGEILLNQDSALEKSFISGTWPSINVLAAENFEIPKTFYPDSGCLETEFSGSVKKAVCGIYNYLNKTAMCRLDHIKTPKKIELTGTMMLDKASIRNLELTETLFERDVKGSLLGILDKCHTAMGGRMIKKWIKEPLIDVSMIQNRLDAVEALYENQLARNNIKTALKLVYDLERLTGRISYRNANARDLSALQRSISALPDIKGEVEVLAEEKKSHLLAELGGKIDELEQIRELIESSIVDEPPFTLREGGLIKKGYSEELDKLKSSISGGQEWIASLEAKERERTGIKNLKVGFNKVFGYYIDITHSYKDKVPEEYIRKQTLVGSERYITPEMKDVESTVLSAEASINELEYEIFNDLREQIRAEIPEIQETSEVIAEIDVLCSFAEASEKYDYTKPVIDEGDSIHIERGRHPVIERNLQDVSFVPNDLYIDRKDRSMLLITGPNMAGKSTYMRQNALIVLMAQAGCFVPAAKAHIGVCDRIYTRIGASDNLTKGESTYYVEMKELAYILNTATDKSLIILDEIGRGTSTYDGLAIAWAVLDRLCDDSGKAIRCLFATHYHELTSLEDDIPGLFNLNTEIAEVRGEVVFLHRIAEGSSSRSYGIHVARLAGVPRDVLEDAESKLRTLEGESGITKPEPTVNEETPQISMFSFAPDPVVEKLKELDLMNIRPSDAFKILEELKEAADEE